MSLITALTGASFTQPDAIINSGIGPLPSIPSNAPASFTSADGQFGLGFGSIAPYSYGANPRRITTQTQMNIPNKVQLVIPRLFIPAATASGGTVHDPVLEHATNDGDLVFSLRMNSGMQEGSRYWIKPYTNSYKCLKLVNLATANYLLWGLQVGTCLPDNKGHRWVEYYAHFCKNQEEPYALGGYTMEHIWNFLQTYLSPYGVQHGSDMQGGRHEGSATRVVTNSTDYVSAFAIEGKLLRVSNLWRMSEVNENDDLVLELAYMPPQIGPIQFNLCSSSRATRTESAPCPMGWWYLKPVVLPYKSIVEIPHIHIGRSQKAISAYTQSKWGAGTPAWNARACVQGAVLQLTFEPDFVMSDDMLLKMLTEWVLPGSGEEDHLQQRELLRRHQAGGGGPDNRDGGGGAGPPHHPGIMHRAGVITGGQVLGNDAGIPQPTTQNSQRDPVQQPKPKIIAPQQIVLGQHHSPAAAEPATTTSVNALEVFSSIAGGGGEQTQAEPRTKKQKKTVTITAQD